MEVALVHRPPVLDRDGVALLVNELERAVDDADGGSVDQPRAV